jgi:hypothetical protein
MYLCLAWSNRWDECEVFGYVYPNSVRSVSFGCAESLCFRRNWGDSYLPWEGGGE